MRISKGEFERILSILDAQRSYTVELYAIIGEEVDPDMLLIDCNFDYNNEDYFNAVAHANYYNGHTNMVDAFLRQMEPVMFLHVMGNKHYIDKSGE